MDLPPSVATSAGNAGPKPSLENFLRRPQVSFPLFGSRLSPHCSFSTFCFLSLLPHLIPLALYF
ncbi:uncharacterized protein M6B38_306315 [Iris pallida]|uniref:Uncharacterized protein n=1 Tax=Iris pallida TaxID=29817 RepID=A0AAX6HK99_IRIPA|nr:uncharacterized protein M6B38_306315 [Iris pallida]